MKEKTAGSTISKVTHEHTSEQTNQKRIEQLWKTLLLLQKTLTCMDS